MERLHFVRILASKINSKFDIKCTNMESLEDLRLNANDMPIMIEKEFKSANLIMHPKLPGLVSDTMKTYNNAKPKTL